MKSQYTRLRHRLAERAVYHGRVRLTRSKFGGAAIARSPFASRVLSGTCSRQKGHGLMQAIARVNRAFQDKPAGLVVDYIGIAQRFWSRYRSHTTPPSSIWLLSSVIVSTGAGRPASASARFAPPIASNGTPVTQEHALGALKKPLFRQVKILEGQPSSAASQATPGS
jgi:hypothetical protein